MQLTTYVKRIDAELLLVLRLNLDISRPIWEPFRSDSGAPQLDVSTREYLQALAQAVEMSLFELPKQPTEDQPKVLRDRLRTAHKGAMPNQPMDEEHNRLRRSIWRNIYRACTSFARDRRGERRDTSSWFSLEGDGRRKPGPVLTSFSEEFHKVLRVIEWAYIDAVGPLGRVHANIEIDVNRIHPPSFMLTDAQDNRHLISAYVDIPYSDEEENPLPTNAVRARRIKIIVPYPCELRAVFGLEWVVAHEVGVHVMQQLNNDEGPLPDGSRMGFSEGFVDAAICDLIYDAATGSNGLGDALPDVVPLTEHIAYGARMRFNGRLQKDVPQTKSAEDREAWIDQLQLGRDFWDYLKTLAAAIEPSTGDRFEPKVWARRVALKLNVLDLSPQLRHVLLSGAYNFRLAGDTSMLVSDPSHPIGLLVQELSAMLAEPDIVIATDIVVDFLENTDGFASLIQSR